MDVKTIAFYGGLASTILAVFLNVKKLVITPYKKIKERISQRRRHREAQESKLDKVALLGERLFPENGPSIFDEIASLKAQGAVSSTHYEAIRLQYEETKLQLQRIIGIQDLTLEYPNRAVMIADRNGDVTFATPLLVTWIGRPLELILRKGWFSYIAFEDRARVKAEYTTAITEGSTLDTIFDFTSGNQAMLQVQMIVQPVYPDELQHGFLVQLFKVSASDRDLITNLKTEITRLSNDYQLLKTLNQENILTKVNDLMQARDTADNERSKLVEDRLRRLEDKDDKRN